MLQVHVHKKSFSLIYKRIVLNHRLYNSSRSVLIIVVFQSFFIKFADFLGPFSYIFYSSFVKMFATEQIKIFKFSFKNFIGFDIVNFKRIIFRT